MLILTTPNIEGKKIVRYLGLVSGEAILGANIFKDFFAGIRDVFGGRSKSSQKVLRDARHTCLTELRREALIVGANAIIAVDMDYSEISGDGKSMLFLVTTGTACLVTKN